VKRFDKRGQEGVSIGTMIGILLAVAFLVIMFMVYQRANVAGTQILKATDIEISLMEQKCNNLGAFSDSISSYCYEKYETKKNNNFINCQYAEANFGVNISVENKPAGESCVDAVTKICNQLELSVDDFATEDYYVNGKLCTKPEVEADKEAQALKEVTTFEKCEDDSGVRKVVMRGTCEGDRTPNIVIEGKFTDVDDGVQECCNMSD